MGGQNKVFLMFLVIIIILMVSIIYLQYIFHAEVQIHITGFGVDIEIIW